MAQFKGVRKLSQKKYDEMKKAGTLDAGIVYVTPTKTLPVLQGTAEPTTALIGEVGQFYLDTVAKKLYQCVSVTTDESAGTTTYEWQAVGGGGSSKYLHSINFWKSGDLGANHMTIEFIDNNDTSYSTFEDIRSALYNCGITDKYKMIMASGYVAAAWVSGLYVTDTQFVVLYNTTSMATKSITIDGETFTAYTSISRRAGSQSYDINSMNSYFETITDTVTEL